MSFLDYAPTPLTRFRSAPTLGGGQQAQNPSAQGGLGVHPAVVSYLSGGQPLRQSYSQLLTKPVVAGGGNQVVPPDGAAITSPLAQGNRGSFSAPAGGSDESGSPATGPGSTVAPGGNYMDDPILQKVLAAQAAALKTVRGNAVGDYEDLLLGFGSQQIARDFLGKLLGNPDYADAAGVGKVSDGKLPSSIESLVGGISDIPDTSQSTLGHIARAMREATRSTNSNLNDAHLFFSGTRGRALRDLDYENQGQISDATQALRQALTGITRGVTGAEQGWQMQVLSAEEAAYMRQLTAALNAAGNASGGPSPGPSGGAAPGSSASPFLFPGNDFGYQPGASSGAANRAQRDRQRWGMH